MSHSYVSNLMHCTFSTKARYPFIDSELESRLRPYIGGIARENRIKALAIGGTNDHLHALLSLPSTVSFAKAVQLIKGRLVKVDSRYVRQVQEVRMAGFARAADRALALAVAGERARVLLAGF